jgi:monofunctional biosynthetic peptidoglycan transglycosylase
MAQTSYRHRNRGPWLRRIFLILVGVTVILPVTLILIFRFVPPPITPLMLGTWLFDGPITRRWVPLEAISPNLVRAVIGSEDGKFCSHYGFDLEAIDKAFANNASGGTVRDRSLPDRPDRSLVAQAPHHGDLS